MHNSLCSAEVSRSLSRLLQFRTTIWKEDGLVVLAFCRADDDLEVGTSTICLEDQLRSLGFICGNDDSLYGSARDPAFFKDINLEANLSNKKIRDAILSMGASDAYILLRKLLALWQSRFFPKIF